jgi:Na+-translocating ferredoxin:NAD+ oxidoreductase RnfG subunit
MKYLVNLPLVNWGMGSVIIGVFALVCVILVAVVYNMVNSDSEKKEK